MSQEHDDLPDLDSTDTAASVAIATLIDLAQHSTDDDTRLEAARLLLNRM